MLLLVLLTLQHHYIQSANNYVNFDHMFAPILMVLPCQQHQYIGQTRPAAPIGKETLIFRKFKNFADFFKCQLHQNIGLTGQHQNVSSTTHIQLNVAYSISWSERKRKYNYSMMAPNFRKRTSITTMQAKNQAFAIFPTPLISHYPLTLKLLSNDMSGFNQQILPLSTFLSIVKKI